MTREPDSLSDAEVQGFFDRANRLGGVAAARELYGDWAGLYDGTIERFGRYLSPDRIAAMVAERCQDRSVAILDVACGTGLVGPALARQGFVQLTGLDLSEPMLAEARRKGCYAALVAGDVAALPDLPRFAMVVCVGALTLCHMGAAEFEAMAGLVAPGGCLVVDVEGGTFQAQGFDALLARLVAEGVFGGVERAEGHFYQPGPDEPAHGWFVTAWRD